MDTSSGEQSKGLQSKWWYRLLRVILIPLYGLVLIVALWAIYSDNDIRPRKVVDEQRSLIVCDDGKTYPVARIGGLSSSEAAAHVLDDDPFSQVNKETHLPESDADAGRNLCSYGQTIAPSDGLVTVQIGDVTITGVPASDLKGVKSDLKGSDLWARYQRWRTVQTYESYLEKAPSQVRKIVRDPFFLALSDAAKRKILLRDPDFRGLPASEQDKVLRSLQTVKPTLQFQALQNETVKVAFNTEGSWAKMVSYMAIVWLVIHLAFVALRGAVLYVAVGRFLPVSGLRGWLTL